MASPAQIAFPIQGIHLPSLDVLIYGVGDTEEQANADHDRKLTKLLERCQSQGMALNPDKPKLRTKSIKFMGDVLINEGIKIDPEKAKAIMNMPRPVDIEGVQRLNGFVNYLSKFLPRLADSMDDSPAKMKSGAIRKSKTKVSKTSKRWSQRHRS